MGGNNLMESLGDLAGKAVREFKGSTTFDYDANRRKYVLNDFSIVSKANIWVFFSIYSTYEKIENKEGIFIPISKLSVQINPTVMGITSGLTPQSILEGLSTKSGEANTIKYNYQDQSDVTIPDLIFDIYDEYIARTGGGSGLGGKYLNASTFGGETESICNSFSLANEKITALAPLIKYSKGDGGHPYCLYFQWGDMEHFGEFKEIDVKYTAFSSTGCPLKATADLKISQPNIPMVSSGKMSWHSWIKSMIDKTSPQWLTHPMAASF